ncbi:hypothetical protein D3C83_30850 [compost metagenome]
MGVAITSMASKCLRPLAASVSMAALRSRTSAAVTPASVCMRLPTLGSSSGIQSGSSASRKARSSAPAVPPALK